MGRVGRGRSSGDETGAVAPAGRRSTAPGERHAAGGGCRCGAWRARSAMRRGEKVGQGTPDHVAHLRGPLKGFPASAFPVTSRASRARAVRVTCGHTPPLARRPLRGAGSGHTARHPVLGADGVTVTAPASGCVTAGPGEHHDRARARRHRRSDSVRGSLARWNRPSLGMFRTIRSWRSRVAFGSQLLRRTSTRIGTTYMKGR